MQNGRKKNLSIIKCTIKEQINYKKFFHKKILN